MATLHPCVWRTTVVSEHCVPSDPPFYCPSSKHEQFMSWWSFFSKAWYPPGNFQMLVIPLVLKPSSPVENNPLQTWPDIVLNFSYIPLPKSMPLSPHEEVINLPLHSLPLTNPQTLEGYWANLVLKGYKQTIYKSFIIDLFLVLVLICLNLLQEHVEDQFHVNRHLQTEYLYDKQWVCEKRESEL